MSIIPPINSKGKFTFQEPFNDKLYESQEYTVTSVRSLLELHNSEEKPYETIYQPVGLTEAEFKEDLDNNIPIIVFTTSGGEYFYVPSDRILSQPQIIGVKYQEKILAISLGTIPLNYNLELAKDTIKQTLYDVTGIDSTVEVIPSSAVILLTKEEDTTLKAILNNRKTIDKSYRTKYLELLELYNKQVTLNNELQICIKSKCIQ